MEEAATPRASDSDSEVSQDSDSEMLSSPSDASSLASSDSSPRSSSPDSPAEAPPALRVPALHFSLGALPTQSGVESPRMVSSRATGGACPSPLALPPRPALPSARGGACAIAVEVLSHAFSVTQCGDAEQKQHQHQQLQAVCASKLGVGSDRIRVYALLEVASVDDFPAGCERVAVEIKGSSFSLQALEQVLVENKNLVATAAVSDARDKQLQAMLAAAQQENASLRKQLDSSEVLRHRSHSLLYELKQEFEALHTELAPHAHADSDHQGDGMATPTAAQPGHAS